MIYMPICKKTVEQIFKIFKILAAELSRPTDLV